MLDGKRVAVVVPAYNEEQLIADDARAGSPPSSTGSSSSTTRSQDATVAARREAVRATRASSSIAHEQNRRRRRRDRHRLQARARRADRRHRVMAADNQMDPDDLRDARRAGRARRGRLREGEPALHRPGVGADPALPLPRQRGALAADEDRVRLLARRRLAVRLHGDRRCATLELLDLDRIYRRYGFPNDMLVHLNVWNARVRDFPSRPIYGVGERVGDPAAQGRAARSRGCSSRGSSGGCGRST